jgi:hypothetical protein
MREKASKRWQAEIIPALNIESVVKGIYWIKVGKQIFCLVRKSIIRKFLGLFAYSQLSEMCQSANRNSVIFS